jgi:cbb3-type cytochrome oxidase maturation protein
MSVILLLILASLLVATAFLFGFIWAVRAGQFEDTSTPSLRMLAEEAGSRGGPGSPVAEPLKSTKQEPT